MLLTIVNALIRYIVNVVILYVSLSTKLHLSSSNFYSLLYVYCAENESNFAASYGAHLEDYDFENGLMELKQFVPEYLWRVWVKEVTEMLQSDRSPDEIWSWLENIKEQYLPNSVSHRSCIKEYTYYVADPKRLPQHGTVLVCDVCMK